MNMQKSGFKHFLTAFGFLSMAGLSSAVFGAVTVPGAPTIGTATAGNLTASIAFKAPSSNGGATITGYTASCVTGSTTVTGTATKTPISVTGLTNGSAYSCTVKATNSAGSSVASGAVSVTPLTVPGAPTIGAATAGNVSASIAFTAPSSNGGSSITGYTASCVTGSTTKTGTGTSSPVTVASLTNGSAYSCTVKATNSAGSSVASGSVAVTPVTVPSAPSSVVGTAGNASASIAFKASSSTGGATISGYTASCVNGSNTITGTATSTPISVTGLTNGTAYSCTVKATNSAGSSTSSSAVSVTPATVPGAPTIGTATSASNTSASVTFSAPSSTGGSAITKYTASCVTSSTTKTASGTTSPLTVSSLTKGSTYSCTVTATNTKGTSASSGSASVTPGSTTTTVTVPGAPTIGAATAGNASASVAFTAPSSTGGATITGYAASCAATGLTTMTATGTSSPISVTGLTNSTVYSCTVKATNSAGTGSASSAVLVTPVSSTITIPGAPTIGAATAGNGSASIAFTAPSSNGGATISSYTASCVTGSTTKTGTGTSSPISVTSLTNSTQYACTVTATNSVGTSSPSGSVSVTPTSSTVSSTVTYSTPANYATLVANTYTPTTTLTAASSVTARGYYMLSDASAASTSSNYAAIDSTYSATTGYALTSGTLASTSTYNDYLTKTLQLVKNTTDGYYRLDSYLHPNNSIDVATSTTTPLQFKNNFGKTVTGNGFVTFDISVNSSTKVVTLTAKNRYIYATTSATVNGNTVYTQTYTADTTFTGTGKYISYSNKAYYLSSSAVSLYLYTSPLSLSIPSFMNPNSISFVTNGAAPFMTKVTTSAIEGTTGISSQVNSTYKSQVATAGTDTTTRAAAVTMLAAIKATGVTLRYSTDVYLAYRDAALATKLVSDSIADGTPGQNMVPYVYFTNEYETSSDGTKTYHPFMVVVSYGNQASPNGLKDVPHPPGSSDCAYSCATVTRYSNLENYTFMIPMKDYGQVTSVTTNDYPSTGTSNLWYNMFGSATTSTYITRDIYTWADTTDNGILIDGSVIFPTYNNGLVPSHLAGELSASGCHVGQGGGGPHCHADGYQSGQGLTLYNDTDYVGKTHPPLLGFGYDGIAVFGRYRTGTTTATNDSTMLGYGTLDDFGAHNHDSIGYHYHAHTVFNHTSYDIQGTKTTKDMYPLMKGAYIGVTSSIPYFRLGLGFKANKYLGGM